MEVYQGKKILIFGLGLNQGGVGSAKFFAKQEAKIRITDLKTADILQTSISQLKQFPDIEYILGQHRKEDIDWADLIIKNPAVQPGNQYLKYAKQIGKRIEQDMGIFLQFVKPSQIIGVTGTKGKSTTASLIYEILKAAGKDVILIGNIGKSVLDFITIMQNSKLTPRRWEAELNKKLIVLELSSFQLESFEQHQVSPKWSVITNIYPDHLNYYQNMKDYITAKKPIGKYQTAADFLFVNKEDPKVSGPTFLKAFKGKIIFYSKDDLPKDFHPILLGKHNLDNMAAAFQVGKVFGLNQQNMLDTLSSFPSLPWRMKLIKTWHKILIYNDTAATSPQAAIHAMQTLASHSPGKKLILICGGMNKGMDYTKFTKAVLQHASQVFFLSGDATEEIKKELSAISNQSSDKIQGTYNDLEKLLTDVKKVAQSGDIILFSPAATSFNLFQNEFDRGKKFNQAVRRIFNV